MAVRKTTPKETSKTKNEIANLEQPKIEKIEGTLMTEKQRLAYLGRMRYTNPEDLLQGVHDYFTYCQEFNKPPTTSGLGVYVGVPRRTLVDYRLENHKILSPEHSKDFKAILDYARAKIEAYAEEQLYTNPKVAGIIFSLKNNYGWRDEEKTRQVQDNTVEALTDDQLKLLMQNIK